MQVCLQFNPGYLHVTPGVLGGQSCDTLIEATVQDFTRELGKKLLLLVRGRTVMKPKGSRGFSFHWSNAQAKWDVIPANDPAWSLDGAEFVVYVDAKVTSPLGKSWSAKEMQYVALRLPPHPGYSMSMEGAQRVAARYLAAQEG